MPLPPLIAIDIPRMEGTPLRVPDAAGLAELFFATEVSSRGLDSYDARTLTTPPHRVDREDIRVLNASFRAMIMRVSLWEPLFEAGDLPWLQALDPSWDPTTMDDATWRRLRVADRVAEAIAELISVKGRGVAQATKLLHLKRPALVPVMDTLVARALGARLSPDAPAATRVEQARAIVEHVRLAVIEVRAQLDAVRAYLNGVGIERSRVRILDALLWCSQADEWVAHSEVPARWRASAADPA